ncbi:MULTISPECIES: ArsR/SmtB family transcription factor [Streptosporangium]|uniref:DNA-binding transcriptional ArsR family regulator n=1 Tax=Streptosporangium brasiliense TaxID=47480 RepID=A0ABT9QVU6_9ACTN|nr:helix-turn-helix domain-containing protein [Streptosporangium brasiliense]MDP9861099.1 DNA-binding transcriptional ArsR family regulator [Streptosporangium brasiliense]
MKDEESFTLDDPAKLKALAHPMRRLMLRHLGLHGPATSTTLGELLGAKTGTTSYHLRQLEKCGFIEEIPERSGGRERWWRRAETPRDMRLPTPDRLAPEDRPVLAEFHRIGWEEDRGLLDRLPELYRRDPEWVKASRGLGRMTMTEFEEFFDAYVALLMKYSHRAEDAPPDARPLYVRLFAFPADES